jgi:hypothetical protein
MNYEYDYEIILLILKIAIIVLWITDIYLKYTPPEDRFLDIKKEEFWTERVSFLFEILIALLLIYLFDPFNPRPLTKMTKLTLFTVGILTILRANWKKFIGESPLIKYL